MLHGKSVDIKSLANVMEIKGTEVEEVAMELKNKLEQSNSGIQLITINDGYQLATCEKYYDKICALIDNRPKPSLSQAAMEVLAIIAYNPKITRAEIEKIRGVSSDSAMNRLLEYGLIEDCGRLDAPGRPTIYKTSDEFLRLFGYDSINDMPELPRLVEEDPQIAIEDIQNDNNKTEDMASNTNDESTNDVPSNINSEEETIENQSQNLENSADEADSNEIKTITDNNENI